MTHSGGEDGQPPGTRRLEPYVDDLTQPEAALAVHFLEWVGKNCPGFIYPNKALVLVGSQLRMSVTVCNYHQHCLHGDLLHAVHFLDTHTWWLLLADLRHTAVLVCLLGLCILCIGCTCLAEYSVCMLQKRGLLDVVHSALQDRFNQQALMKRSSELRVSTYGLTERWFLQSISCLAT